jgi:hypothetical protein
MQWEDDFSHHRPKPTNSVPSTERGVLWQAQANKKADSATSEDKGQKMTYGPFNRNLCVCLCHPDGLGQLLWRMGGGTIGHKPHLFPLADLKRSPDRKRPHAIASRTLFGIAAAIVLRIS